MEALLIAGWVILFIGAGTFALLLGFLLEERWIGFAFATLVLGMSMVIIGEASRDDRKREVFMRDCKANLKAFECEAMWRAGEPRTVPVVTPLFIPPVRR